MKKRLWSMLLVVAMCLTMLPVTALAAGTFKVLENGQSVTFTSNSTNYTSEYTVTQENANISVSGSTTNQRIIVNASNVTITLDNASMLLNDCNGSPIEIAEGKSATLILKGTNKLTAYADGPGILVNQGATLTIKADDTDPNASLTVNGAQMDYYVNSGGISGGMMSGFAGIGGPNSSNALTYTGTINIESGIINANGYGYGAGIGGGDYSSGGTINISGGTVTAICGGTDPNGWVSATDKKGSGIGASQGQASGTITISGDADVTAYGGYACAGIGGGTANVTIEDSATVVAYGGQYAAGIGGYNQNKGTSTITISNTANVTAYGGTSASGLGQGSAASTVNLSLASTATVIAYSDGTKAAITGTPSNDSADILNLYMKNITLPSVDIPLTLTGNMSTVVLKAGYKAVGTLCTAGDYTVSANLGTDGTYRIVPSAGNSFEVVAGNDSTAYNGVQTMLLGIADGGATVQLNPPNGVKISSGSTTPLNLNSQTGMIEVPAGGKVDSVTWSKGGTVSKAGVLNPNFDDTFTFEKDLSASENVDIGESLTLSVTVTEPQDGSTLSYQWYKDGTAIAGETGASLTLDSVTEDDLGSYYVVVTKSLSGKTETLNSQSCTVALSTYTIVVNGGTSSVAESEAGKTIAITAEVPSGKKFVNWTTEDGVTFADANAQTTTFTMPAKDVTVTANFRSSGVVVTPIYPPTITESDNGDVTVSPTSPKQGDTVTITPKPDNGYEVDKVTVTDSNGKEITVKDNGDGTYSFTQPSGKVTITVTFQAIGCPKDSTCPISKFTDSTPTAWYHDGVHYVLENGLMVGISDTEFAPNATLTRAELAQILYNKAGKPEVSGLSTFTDVPATAWYAKAVAWAQKNNVVSGVGGNQFAPNQIITRESIAVMLYNEAGKPTVTGTITGFADAANVSAWAKDAVLWATQNKVLNGAAQSDGTLLINPTNGATRAEAAALLENYYNQ